MSSLLQPAGSALSLDSFPRLFGTSLFRHGSISAIAYYLSRNTNRLEGKDWLWPSGMLLNTWWSVLASGVSAGVPITTILKELGFRERLLLTGVSAWSLRLFYRIASRSIRRGKDDPKHEDVKKEQGFWNKALFSVFLPEAACQALITIPFTAPFMPGVRGLLSVAPLGFSDDLAVGLFGTGMAIEGFADAQMETYRQGGKDGVFRDGAWSIVRHPNCMGNALVHMSFPLLLWGTPAWHPLELLGTLMIYLIQRYLGGDQENERTQEERWRKAGDTEKLKDLQVYREETNSFWPSLREVGNPFLWRDIGLGAILMVGVEAVRRL